MYVFHTVMCVCVCVCIYIYIECVCVCVCVCVCRCTGGGMTTEWVRRTHTHTMTEESRQFAAALTTTSSPPPATAQYATIYVSPYCFPALFDYICPHIVLQLYSTMCVSSYCVKLYSTICVLILHYCFTSSPPPATAQYALVIACVLQYIAALLLLYCYI